MQNRPTPPRARRGFSLLEILIAVSVITILAGVVTPALSNRIAAARDTRRAQDLVAVQEALDAYYEDNGSYPSTGGSWQGDAPNYGGMSYGASGYIPGLVPDYLPALPKDPDAHFPLGNAGYLYRSSGTEYKFLAHYTPDTYPTNHRFYDPQRVNYAWQVSSPGGYNW